MTSLFILSVTIFLISTIVAIAHNRLFKNKAGIKPIYILIAGIFLSIFSILLYVDFKPETNGFRSTGLIALFHSIQIMLLGYDFEFIQAKITMATVPYSDLLFAYIALLFVLGPIYTFGFVLSFFENISANIKCFLKRNCDIYVLSDLNIKTLPLAKSIRQKDKSALIIFTNVFSNLNEQEYDLLEDAKSINAITFKKDICDFNFSFHSKNSKMTFFIIADDESLNLDISLNIIDKFNNRKNTELYVFSTSNEGELLLDSVDDGAMKVRRINENRSFAYSMIYNHPITEQYTKQGEDKIISTLIVGFGGYGTEITKSLLWCGQLPGYYTEINVIDKNPLTETQFTAECPEIMKLNNNKEVGEAKYSLNFYSGVDITTNEFIETISKLCNTSIIYVSLGNDELNIETAIKLRIHFERIGLFPVIRAIVYSDIKHKMLSERSLRNFKYDDYKIEIIGNISSRFSYDAIVNEELESLALKFHLAWSNTPDEIQAATKQFNEYEYFRSSSIATAIHDKYRKLENIPSETAAIYEHMRWNAYMRTEGYVFSGSCEKSTRNDRAKMHNNMHRFGLLNDDDINKDRRITELAQK